MKKAAAFLTFIILLIAVSCENKKGLLPPQPVPLAPNACDSIRYMNAAKPIIDKYCVSCHSGPFPNGGIDFSAYVNAKAKALDGRLKDRMTNTNNPMPPFGLMPQAQIDSLMCWIEKGAPL